MTTKTDLILVELYKAGAPLTSYQLARRVGIYTASGSQIGGSHIRKLASGLPKPDSQSVYNHLKAPINKGFVGKSQMFNPKLGKTVWFFILTSKGIKYLESKRLI